MCKRGLSSPSSVSSQNCKPCCMCNARLQLSQRCFVCQNCKPCCMCNARLQLSQCCFVCQNCKPCCMCNARLQLSKRCFVCMAGEGRAWWWSAIWTHCPDTDHKTQLHKTMTTRHSYTGHSSQDTATQDTDHKTQLHRTLTTRHSYTDHKTQLHRPQDTAPSLGSKCFTIALAQQQRR